MELGKFLLECLLDGLHIGEHAFGIIEGFCVIVAAGMLWVKHHRLHGFWEKWEPRIKKTAFIIFAISFVVSTCFVAPFLRYKKAETGREEATNELAGLRGELKGNPGLPQLRSDIRGLIASLQSGISNGQSGQQLQNSLGSQLEGVVSRLKLAGKWDPGFANIYPSVDINDLAPWTNMVRLLSKTLEQ